MSVKAHMSDGVWKVCKATKQPCPLREYTTHRYFEDIDEMKAVNTELVADRGREEFGILAIQEVKTGKSIIDFNDENKAKEFNDEYLRQYTSLYEADIYNDHIDGRKEAEARFDSKLTEAEYETLKSFSRYRKDIIASDREGAAFVLTLDKLNKPALEKIVDFTKPEEAKKFSKEFAKQYDFLYEADVNNQYVAGSKEALAYFDNDLTENEKDTLVNYIKHRKDPVSSDREAIAFMFAIDNFKK